MGVVRCIIRIVKATSFSVLLDNCTDILMNKYLNSSCIEHKIESGFIAIYIGSLKEGTIKCKLLLENWKKVYLRKVKN